MSEFDRGHGPLTLTGFLQLYHDPKKQNSRVFQHRPK